MKIVSLLSILAAAQAFVPSHENAVLSKTQLQGWMDNFNFKPIHGHGSGENKLGQIFREEQALLKDRKEHYNKDTMRKKYKKQNTSAGFLQDFFSHPFHAQGSSHDESELDAMYEAQQQVLYERREYFGNKDKLRQKYSRHVDHLKDIPLHQHDPKRLNEKEDDAMYVDENYNEKQFEIPFLKNFNHGKLKP